MNLVPFTSPTPTFTADWLLDPAEIAAKVGNTTFVPERFRGNIPVITAALIYGAEIGLKPMQALDSLYEVNGRIGISAEKQRALILHAGHDIWIEDLGTTRVTVAGQRKDSDQVSRITWTMDDARRAGLAGKPPWKMYPRQMLLARASAELARAVFPDAIGGLAATEELQDQPDLAGLDGGREEDAQATEPVAPKRRRRRASVSAPATTPAAPQPQAGEEPPIPGDQPQFVAPTDTTSEPLTEGQRTRLHATFRDKQIVGRDDRLAYVSTLIGRQVESSKELTVGEASIVLEHLEQFDPNQPDTWPAGEQF